MKKIVIFSTLIILCFFLLAITVYATEGDGGYTELNPIAGDTNQTIQTIQTIKTEEEEASLIEKIIAFLPPAAYRVVAFIFSAIMTAVVGFFLIQKHNLALKRGETSRYVKSMKLVDKRVVDVGITKTVHKGYYANTNPNATNNTNRQNINRK